MTETAIDGDSTQILQSQGKEEKGLPKVPLRLGMLKLKENKSYLTWPFRLTYNEADLKHFNDSSKVTPVNFFMTIWVEPMSHDSQLTALSNTTLKLQLQHWFLNKGTLDNDS